MFSQMFLNSFLTKIKFVCLVYCLPLPLIHGTIFYHETFSDESYTESWIESSHRGIDQGKFELGAGKYFGDFWNQRGLRTSQDSKFYGISVKFNTPFSNRETNLVIQYQVKFEESVQCGGGYLKVLGSDFDPPKFQGHTPYRIMFGPDICGEEKKMVHVILNYKGKYFMIKKNIKCKTDQYSHLYTLIITPNNTYSVLIDNIRVENGTLEDDFDFLNSKFIDDPDVTKPLDWVDEEKIDDPEDVKSPDWDQPMTMSDPNAKKPANWDEGTDGVWEPPLVDNPDYKGKWKPRRISNPAYKGPWTPPKIPNPEYVNDFNLYLQEDIGGIGFDIWQVKAGSIFDNVLITDSPKQAAELGESNWREAFEDEQVAFKTEKEHEKEQRVQMKKLDEERKRAEEAEAEDEIIDDEQKSKETKVKDEL